MVMPPSIPDQPGRSPRGRRPAKYRLAALAAALLLLAGWLPAMAQEAAPILLKVAGGLAGLVQYDRYEAPFWTTQVPRLTQGRVQAEIAPFDRSGIRSQDMPALIRLGVVPFGNIHLAMAAGDEPELNAIDLPVLNPDLATLRQSLALWRPRIARLLLERYGVELLAVYTYPAQVVFCREAFARLDDLRGRRVRVSSVGQAELLEAVGAIPVVIPFAEIMPAMRRQVVDCAVTGSLSGNALGLQTITSHLSRQAISWGVTAFGANRTIWQGLPGLVRDQLQGGLAQLEEEIWQAAGQETEEGFACNAGRPECRLGTPGHMVLLEDSPQERRRRDELLRDAVLPAWVRRCGSECAEAWNATIAPVRGILAPEG
ncbi:MAG: ABC transporter substrate-binding protein [Acetobacteraceae bacterium]|nr:MAG: ABC transporter substrate-binding protein [Acetobacteraceae bacterium]